MQDSKAGSTKTRIKTADGASVFENTRPGEKVEGCEVIESLKKDYWRGKGPDPKPSATAVDT
ncbi:TPA: hypothetical protein HA338_07025 [Methanosarcina acetivorans]|uniref:Uncharacterized protein n=1 Tax=Methanosarcina acetivorans TaxID=2214 RepID=A0A832SHI6_9EURY|nr:hypothetical protein [Methanosarcina acetivorans]HIH93792.1 hypothetical protein [Methanosarcina acetivorans]